MMSFNSELHEAVEAKAERYMDKRPLWMSSDQLRFRILCAALEKSGKAAPGSFINFAGTMRALFEKEDEDE